MVEQRGHRGGATKRCGAGLGGRRRRRNAADRSLWPRRCRPHRMVEVVDGLGPRLDQPTIRPRIGAPARFTVRARSSVVAEALTGHAPEGVGKLEVVL